MSAYAYEFVNMHVFACTCRAKVKWLLFVSRTRLVVMALLGPQRH